MQAFLQYATPIFCFSLHRLRAAALYSAHFLSLCCALVRCCCVTAATAANAAAAALSWLAKLSFCCL